MKKLTLTGLLTLLVLSSSAFLLQKKKHPGEQRSTQPYQQPSLPISTTEYQPGEYTGHNVETGLQSYQALLNQFFSQAYSEEHFQAYQDWLHKDGSLEGLLKLIEITAKK